MRTASRLCWLCIRAYQLVSSGYPPACRYVPSCSNYALEALENHGFIRGVGLMARRICRCHPWGGSGWDPVPMTGNSQTVSKESSGV